MKCNTNELTELELWIILQILISSNHNWQVVQLIAAMLLIIVLCQLKSPRRVYFTLVKSLTVADLLYIATPFSCLIYIRIFYQIIK